MNHSATSEAQALPFEKGYPVNVAAHNFLDTVESLMISRGADRGIQEVAIQDANVPLAGAMRRDILLPVLVDYVNFVIHPQADLQYDSALNDELTAGVASDLANEQQRPPIEDDVHQASEVVGSVLGRTPLFNTPDNKAGLSTRTELSKAVGMPLSVTLLMLDTALESAHNLSMKYQQESLGQAETEILDLTPVCNLIAALNVNSHLNELPRNVHDRLQAILAGPDNTQSDPQNLDGMLDDPSESDQPDTKPEVQQ